MRIAIADIGTNSSHMLIAEINGGYRLVDRLKERSRLGEALHNNLLSLEGMERVGETLKRFAALAERRRVSDVVIYATDAMRRAKNRDEVLTFWHDTTGLAVEVISGEREANLSYLGAGQSVGFDKSNLVFDLGGGSLEIAVGDEIKANWVTSLPLGALMMTKEFVTEPIDQSQKKQIKDKVKACLAPFKDQLISLFDNTRFIGTSGAFENIGQILANRDGHGGRSINGYVFSHRELENLTREITKLPMSERAKIEGLDPGRADIFPAALLTILTVVQELGIEKITVSTGGLREGMLAEYISRQDQTVLKPRETSVIAIAQRFNAFDRHSRKVAKLADILFQQMTNLWHLTEKDRELLWAAAMLHDIGYAVNPEKHQKHSYYLIRNSNLLGFEQNEIDMIANIARYHRKSLPKETHSEYTKLNEDDRKLVRKLSAILRIADGFDRGHADRINDLKIVDIDENIVIEVNGIGNIDLEIWGAEQKSDLFQQEIGKKIKIVSLSNYQGA